MTNPDPPVSPWLAAVEAIITRAKEIQAQVQAGQQAQRLGSPKVEATKG